MANILEEIAEKTKRRIEDRKKKVPLSGLRKEAEKKKESGGFPFEQALKAPGVSFICEVKKASPSKGLIAPDFPYQSIAKAYESAGASAISVLTEPYYFQGLDRYLAEIHKLVKTPLLRKDFIVDEYMIYEAKLIGASAVLLICSLLEDERLKAYFSLAEELGLSALVETHDEAEVERAVKIGARVIGVNNRDLKTFTVDIENSKRLRKLVPSDRIFVSESGIHGTKEIKELAKNDVDAVLVGESLMRAENIETVLKDFIQSGK